MELSAGIRQGCFLSPLLFVVVADGLLRCIQREAPDAFVRMYADNAAIVVQDVEVEMPQMQKIFQAVGEAARLRLNIQKCVYSPLFLPSECDLSQLLSQTVPEVRLEGHVPWICGRPDRGHLAWDKVFKKAAERVRLWQWGQSGQGYRLDWWQLGWCHFACRPSLTLCLRHT